MAEPVNVAVLNARLAAAHERCSPGQRDIFSECLRAVKIVEALCDAANGLLFCAAMNVQDVPEPWKQHLDALSTALGRVEREEK